MKSPRKYSKRSYLYGYIIKNICIAKLKHTKGVSHIHSKRSSNPLLISLTNSMGNKMTQFN